MTLFLRAAPHAKDALDLPVADVAAAIPYYEKTFKFTVVSRGDQPHKSAILARDKIQIGLAENGGDPTQEGCFFEVDDIVTAFEEIKGKSPTDSDINSQNLYGTTYRVFFEVAPDGLCYMLGQPVK
jgi:lactoylglutathione lyase